MKDWGARHDDIERVLADLAPRVLQGNVRTIDDYPNAKRLAVRLNGVNLCVILEVECHASELWAHLSMSAMAAKRVPSWEELRWCKEYFLGDRKALQVLPPRAEYVNLNPHVLHLYAPLERDPLPDFRGIDSGGRLAI
jgi:hypothetical protein